VGCSTCSAGEASSSTARPNPGCQCSLPETEQIRTRLRVGCSAGILDAPIEFALARGNYQGLSVNLNWVQCPPCAGAVMSMLTAGLVDMALMHTEDAVAFAAEGNPLRLCGTYVASPRTWGIYVNPGGKVCCSADLRGGSIGMPDDKGTTVALSVFGDAPGWTVLLYCPRRPFTSLRRAANAMAREITRATLWEKQSAYQALKSCEWDLLAQAHTPWPALLLVASKEALYAKASAVRRFIRFARGACRDFKAARTFEEARAYIASRYGMTAKEAQDLLAETDWVCDCKVDVQSLTRPLDHLKRTGLITPDRAGDLSRLVAKELCTLSSESDEGNEPGTPSSPPPLKTVPLEDEDFDCGFPPADLVAESDRAGAEQFVVKGGKEDYVPVPAG